MYFARPILSMVIYLTDIVGFLTIFIILMDGDVINERHDWEWFYH